MQTLIYSLVAIIILLLIIILVMYNAFKVIYQQYQLHSHYKQTVKYVEIQPKDLQEMRVHITTMDPSPPTSYIKRDLYHRLADGMEKMNAGFIRTATVPGPYVNGPRENKYELIIMVGKPRNKSLDY